MRPATRFPLAICLLAFLLFPSPTVVRRASAAATDCEGDACPSVTFTFDDTKQQYHAQNNSQDRWARVTASNLAASSSACLAPGKDAYLTLKTVVGSYRADYAETRCGEQGAGR
jgi:hypothetical protein